MKKPLCVLVGTLGLLLCNPAHPSAGSRATETRGIAVYWLLDQAVLEDGPNVVQPDHLGWERPYTVSVDVGIEVAFKNDDGSRGEYIGTIVEGTSTQTIAYNNTESNATSLGDKVGYAASGLAGQEVGFQLSQKAAEAARTAASQASPLNPTAQWGNWFADAASTGRNLAGRMIGAIGGISKTKGMGETQVTPRYAASSGARNTRGRLQAVAAGLLLLGCMFGYLTSSGRPSPDTVEKTWQRRVRVTPVGVSPLTIARRNATAATVLWLGIFTAGALSAAGLPILGWVLGTGAAKFGQLGIPLLVVAAGVVPHGVLEIGALVWCGAAGLAGWRVVPLMVTRADDAMHQLWLLFRRSLRDYVAGLVVLVAAAFIEAYITPIAFRWIVAWYR